MATAHRVSSHKTDTGTVTSHNDEAIIVRSLVSLNNFNTGTHLHGLPSVFVRSIILDFNVS